MSEPWLTVEAQQARIVALEEQVAVVNKATQAAYAAIMTAKSERDAARALIRSMLDKQRGYNVGCKCNGCREIAAALGEA